MDSDQYMDSVSIELKTLAENADLPMQILECLVHTGFDTVTSIAELTNLNIVETFLRENCNIFQDSAKRARIYGVYDSTPENFSFLPGHVIRLNKFIDLCKSIAKKKEAKLKQTVRAITNVVVEVHRNPSASCSYSDETSNTTSRCSSSGPSPLPSIVLSPPSQDNHKRRSSHATQHGPNSSKLATYNALKFKLKKWADGNTDPDIKNLQLGQHYKIIVAQKLLHDDDDEHAVEEEESLFQINAFIFCCMCNKNVQMNIRKTTFAISNATRHLSLCVSKASKKQKELNISNLLSSQGEGESDVQQEEQVELEQQIIIDGEVISQ